MQKHTVTIKTTIDGISYITEMLLGDWSDTYPGDDILTYGDHDANKAINETMFNCGRVIKRHLANVGEVLK